MAGEADRQDEDPCAARMQDHGPRPALNVIHIAKLLTGTEERLVDTERELIEAVRRTIHVTEGMIALVRSTTATTHVLMAPIRGAPAGCAGAGTCSKDSLHCACRRVGMAKELVRVVQGLNHTAGSLNQATDFLIKLSNGLSPREDLAESCDAYLAGKVVAVGDAVRSICQVQAGLRTQAERLSKAADDLRGGGDADAKAAADAIPERDQAVKGLEAMAEGAVKAVAELGGTADTLRATSAFMEDVLRELQGLAGVQVCPEAGAVLLDQLECPVCYQATAPPALWTCANGHVVCATCRSGVLTCPTCRGPLSSRPAMLLTAWTSSLRGWCPHRHKGCVGLLSLADRAKHLEACEHRGGSGSHLDDKADLVLPDAAAGKMIPADEDTGSPATPPVTAAVAPEVDHAPAAPVPSPRPAPAPAPVPDEPTGPLPAEPPELPAPGLLTTADPLHRSRESLGDSDNSHAAPQRKRLRTRRKIFPCCVM